MPGWEQIKLVLDVVGYISTTIVVTATLYGGYLSVSGFLPALIRLGNGLTKRKIALFANGDMAESLQALFADSKLFRTSNIIRVAHGGDLRRAESASVFLVYWPHWHGDLANIISLKQDATALVVYAPQAEGPLPPAAIQMLERERNVVLANFRGRLLNDVVVSLITSAYAKK